MYTLGATPKKVPIFLLLFFSFVLGCQYVFLTPPWQAPDEITHYEYIDILSRAKLFQIRHESDYVLQRRIINSMDRFNAWNYVFRERPSPMPKKFWGLPLYGGSNTKLKRPPLYYILGSFVLKIFGTDDLLLKHYSIRLFSLLLSLLTLFFVYKAAKIIFPDDPYLSLTATCLVAFLPEFLITGFKVHTLPGIGDFLNANLPRWFTQGMNLDFYFGGTSVLIVVGVAMDTMQQIEAQLIMRHYDGFMRRGRLRGRRG